MIDTRGFMEVFQFYKRNQFAHSQSNHEKDNN